MERLLFAVIPAWKPDDRGQHLPHQSLRRRKFLRPLRVLPANQGRAYRAPQREPISVHTAFQEGRRTEFKIGAALRERYDSFLGSEYNINLVDARSTVANRTKMSMLLVLASLFPPTGELVWNEELFWQPIPYNTFDNDKVGGGFVTTTLALGQRV